MSDPAELKYHWLAADGTKRSGSEAELRSALRNANLSPSSFVWRSGWAEWLPAHRVSELSSAISQAQSSSRLGAKPSSNVIQPSLAPPAVKLPSLAPRRPSSRAEAHAPSRARDTLPPSHFGVNGPEEHPRPSSAAPAPPSRGRSPQPTLSEGQGAVSATATLRPPGAVPPPARGVPVPALDSSPRASLTPLSDVGPAAGKPARAIAASSTEAAHRTRLYEPEPAALTSEYAKEPSAPQPSSSTSAHDGLAALEAPVPSSARHDPLLEIGRVQLNGRALLMALSALSGALLVALVALVLLSLGRSPSRAAPGLGASASARTAPTAAPALGCRLALPAARIAADIERSVPPYAANFANDGSLGLGIAATKTRGVGLRLDPRTLDVVSAFEEEGKDAVRGVVPLTRAGTLTFFVDRDDQALRSAHTIDAIPPFTLGSSEAGFSRVVAGNASLVWPLEAAAKITEPRVAELAGFGYGVTFRRGGQAGAVVLGYLSADGAQKSALVEVPGAPKFLGTPVIAAGAGGVLVAFAGRDSADAVWKLFVASSRPGALPGPARALSGADESGMISPNLAALPGGRWLVQWTEGRSGQYQVRVQSFAPDLSPIARSVLVSPKGANAGQGSLATAAGIAVTLFILTTAGHDELWGATLACP